MNLRVLSTMQPPLRFCRLSVALVLCLGLNGISSAYANADDLAYYLPPGEVLWLGASADEVAEASQNEQPAPLRMLVLARENEQYYDRGSMLLIAELGTHPMQSLTMQKWYQGMPHYGWDTYAVQPPTSQVIEFAWQEEGNQRYPQGSDVSTLRDAMRERLSLALDHAALQPGPIVVVAEGVSAALITDILAQGTFPQVDAFVALGAYYPQWQLNQALATTTAQLHIPTLDFIPQHSHSWIADNRARRNQQARRHQHTSYRQRELLTTRAAGEPRYLLHQLYGWLRSEDF